MSTLLLDGQATILAVDDDGFARRLLTEILEHKGFRVWQAGSASEALPLVERDPDVVLLDVHLPDLDGFEVCRRIKTNPATAVIPVVMISGYSVSIKDWVHGLEDGADAYLTKPIDPEELIAQVNTLLRVRQFEEKAIKAQKQAESERPLLRLVIDTLPVGVRMEDRSGNVVLANAATRRIWSCSEGSTKHHIENCRVRRHDAGGEDASAPSRVLATGEPVLNQVLDVDCRDGARKTLLTSVVPVRDEVGSVVAAVVVDEDITERLRLEARFQQAQKMEAFGQLAGGVAHDFNNLLTIIIGSSHLIVESLPAGDPCRDMAGEVIQAGERAASLTRQLLAFSRRQVLAPQVLDLNTTVLEVKKMLRRIIGEDLTLQTALSPSLGAIRADKGQIEQILFNLAVNARDAMPLGGTLTIETRNVNLSQDYSQRYPDMRAGSYTMLAVTDTGCGMTREVQARIFEPFFTTKGPGKGTGLGLATVYGIVKQSGGHIEAYSELGIGSTFKIYLPHVEQPETEGNASPSERTDVGGNETILLIEDDAEVRMLASHILQNVGYNVMVAGCGEEALQIIEERAAGFDLVVTDVVMPGIGGAQLARRVSTLLPGAKMLFLSGYTEDAVMRHGILEGSVNFLQKPFAPRTLLQTVRAVLDAGQEKAASGSS